MSTIKGKKVKITAKGDLQGAIGTIRYVGPLEDKKGQGDYVGVQLDKPLGKNNGTLGQKEYFKAKDKHGAFIKPSYLVLPNGTSIANLLSKGSSGGTGGASKLSKQLGQMQNQQVQNLKKELQEANMKIKQLEETDALKQLSDYKQTVKELEQSNRVLKLENEKVKYAVKQQDDDKLKDLNEKIQFFKSQKESIEKQKADLKKKNAQLSAQLQEYAENLEMIEQLTIKNQSLEAKNQKIKQELEAANGQLKNLKMMGQSSTATSQQLTENLRVLNETVALLESDLKQEKQKNTQLTDQLSKSQNAQTESKKLQMKIKQKTQQIQQLTLQLQACSDAATYAQKLTLDNLKKDQQIKQKTVKINQYLARVQELENQLNLNKQFQDQLNTELLNQEQMIDKLSQQIQQKNLYIAELSRQIQKYKKKIFDFTSQNSELAITSNIAPEQLNKEEQIIPKSYLGFDQYQNKYYNALKVQQHTSQKLLQKQLEFSKIRNDVGVYMLNINEALPQEFSSKFYPQVVKTLTSIKSANDKLYYIFEICSETFKNKSEIYSKENQELAQWLILLMKQVSMLYSSLHKLQLSLSTAQNQEQLSQVLAHRVLGDQVRRIQNFATELLFKFAQDNISASIDIQPFEQPIQTLDQINIAVKKSFNKQYQVKMRLCYQAMQAVIKTYEMIINYKSTSQLGQNAQVDNLLENLIKSVIEYLTQCCLNPYIRYKAEMISYLEGMDIISNIFNDIKLEGNYQELGNLYSESQNIKMLKQTILTTQYHVRELLKDLQDIVYPSELSKIQTQLPGKVWQVKLKSMKEELLKVKQVYDQKVQLEQQLTQTKKKTLILERDVKDKQNSKQVYQKRIGELQLKVEQATTLQNENKRYVDKIKSYQQANKIIQEEMLQQSKKRKLLEEQLKKIKQKYDILQTDVMMRSKRQKTSNLQGLNSEDVANLAIFKNAIKQSNNYRTLETKKKMMQLKQSPIYNMNPKKDQAELLVQQMQQSQPKAKNINLVRRNVLDQMSKLKIINPLQSKAQKNSNNFNIDKILQEINAVSIQQIRSNKQQKKDKNKGVILDIGKLIIPQNRKQTAYLKISESNLGYISQ